MSWQPSVCPRLCGCGPVLCLSLSTCLPAGMADADDGELTESNALAREAYREKQAALREKIAEAKRARERLQDLSKGLVELKHEKFRAFMDVSAAALPTAFWRHIHKRTLRECWGRVQTSDDAVIDEERMNYPEEFFIVMGNLRDRTGCAASCVCAPGLLDIGRFGLGIFWLCLLTNTVGGWRRKIDWEAFKAYYRGHRDMQA